MKNIILASAVLVSSFGVYAVDRCEVISSLAESTMVMRQSGVPASEAYKASADTPEAVRRLFQEMVMQAYSRPAWNSDGAQRKEISEFSSEWFLVCLNAVGEK